MIRGAFRQHYMTVALGPKNPSYPPRKPQRHNGRAFNRPEHRG